MCATTCTPTTCGTSFFISATTPACSPMLTEAPSSERLTSRDGETFSGSVAGAAAAGAAVAVRRPRAAGAGAGAGAGDSVAAPAGCSGREARPRSSAAPRAHRTTSCQPSMKRRPPPDRSIPRFESPPGSAVDRLRRLGSAHR
eukprot:4360824-Prymnesium_polylepis.2